MMPEPPKPEPNGGMFHYREYREQPANIPSWKFFTRVYPAIKARERRYAKFGVAAELCDWLEDRLS